jgi:hypothetical protein
MSFEVLFGMTRLQAIVDHQTSKTYDNLIKAIYGVLFLATPHRGSDFAKWIVFATNTLRIVPGMRLVLPTMKVMRELRSKNTALTYLTIRFGRQLSSLEVVSFFELKKMIGVPALVSF